MKKIKIVTVVGTRPEIIRLSSVISKLNKLDEIEHILIHTGQNYDYELNEIFFKDLNLKKPDFYLDAAKGDSINTIGNILIEIDKILDKLKPDAFLVLGDTNSCLSSIAAKKRQIPIFHVEAGNRCFDQRVPEETNRKIVDHIADINISYSTIARSYLINEGIPSDRVIKLGSPMYEVLNSKSSEIQKSSILQKLNLQTKKYFLVSSHREENINSKNFDDLVDSLNKLALTYDIPVIVSTHPRTKKMIETKQVKFHSLVKIIKPLSFTDYNKLQLDSKCVLSDSGTISEESSILGFKAINIRESHERPEAMEEATVIMSGLKFERIQQSINVTLELDTKKIVYDYHIENFSDKLIKVIISYIDYVKRSVYKKY